MLPLQPGWEAQIPPPPCRGAPGALWLQWEHCLGAIAAPSHLSYVILTLKMTGDMDISPVMFHCEIDEIGNMGMSPVIFYAGLKYDRRGALGRRWRSRSVD